MKRPGQHASTPSRPTRYSRVWCAAGATGVIAVSTIMWRWLRPDGKIEPERPSDAGGETTMKWAQTAISVLNKLPAPQPADPDLPLHDVGDTPERRALLEHVMTHLRIITVDQLGISAGRIGPNARWIDDLGADSLDTVELIMAIEEEFKTSITDEDAEKLVKVRDCVRYLAERIEKRKAVLPAKPKARE